MTKWKYTCYCANIMNPGFFISWSDGSNFTKSKSGKTDLDTIEEMGEAGWELVGVTPIATGIGNHSGITSQLLFTFKRPIE